MRPFAEIVAEEDAHNCEHDWVYVPDWEGDPSVPNGTHDVSYYECTKCEEVSYDMPDCYEDPMAVYGDYLYDRAKDAKGETE